MTKRLVRRDPTAVERLSDETREALVRRREQFLLADVDEMRRHRVAERRLASGAVMARKVQVLVERLGEDEAELQRMSPDSAMRVGVVIDEFTKASAEIVSNYMRGFGIG